MTSSHNGQRKVKKMALSLSPLHPPLARTPPTDIYGEERTMTCVDDSYSEIEVFEMRGRRAAFIYPACSETRIPLLLLLLLFLLLLLPSFFFSLFPFPLNKGLSFESSSYWPLVNFSFSSFLRRASLHLSQLSFCSLLVVLLVSSSFSRAREAFSLRRRTAAQHCVPLLPFVFALECKLCALRDGREGKELSPDYIRRNWSFFSVLLYWPFLFLSISLPPSVQAFHLANKISDFQFPIAAANRCHVRKSRKNSQRFGKVRKLVNPDQTLLSLSLPQ